MLDSPASCIAELSSINTEIAEFAAVWAENAGELKEALKRYDRLYRAGLLGVKGDFKVAEKEALAHAAVGQHELGEGLPERIEELENKVTSFSTQFKSLDRRASVIQSILAAYRAEAKTGEFVVPDPSWSGSA